MATSEVWLDFEQIRHNIKNNTVDRLKQILSGLNEECSTHFSKSGKKQDIIDRISMTLDSWRTGNAEDKFLKAKAIIYQVRNTGIYTPTRLPPIPNVAAGPSTAHTTYDPPKLGLYSSSTAGTSTIGHYDPYAPPRRPSGPLPSSSSSSQKVPGIRFKDSPFFAVDQAVTSAIECPESTSATDRRQQSLSFTLNNDQINKLKTPGDRYQLRLFCTSSIFYAGLNSFHSNTIPCPMEFPPTCEVRVNNTQITANLKGLKKKPGTAPPPDIGKYSRITGGPNRVEMVYVNSQQPVQSKKFYIIVMLVEVIKIDKLVVNLRTQHQRSANEIRQKMKQSMIEDDDIVAGPQKMSLRCPLTFTRIATPCRSSKCVHPQCFDATSWFTMMEQTTTWLCPVCERTLDHKDLVMDGYFDEILQQTPESVEDVMVEADGQWHTSDNKYGSADWKAAHPPPTKSSSPTKSLPPLKQSPPCPPVVPNDSGQLNGKGKAPSHEIFVLDSDSDEEEGRVKRELSPSYASSANQSFEGTLPGASQSQVRADTSVIDLTLDESDEDNEPLPSIYGKRRAADAELDSPNATDQSWKKGRLDPSSRILPAPRPGTMNGVAPVLHSSSINNHQPASPHRYGSFSNNMLPLPTPYPQFNARSGSSSSSLQLPVLSSNFLRQSQNSRWPA